MEINERLLEPFYEDNEIDVSKFICGLHDRGLHPLSDPRFKTIINKLVTDYFLESLMRSSSSFIGIL